MKANDRSPLIIIHCLLLNMIENVFYHKIGDRLYKILFVVIIINNHPTTYNHAFNN